MTARALIIAIESYPSVAAGGIAKNLPGTIEAGLAFKDWLLRKWTAEKRSNSQLIFCSEPQQPGASGATAKDIRRALLKLKEDGQSATEELFVFFSGHGFSFVKGPGRRADVIIASDFETPALSGNACLNLDAIVAWLRVHLGSGRHYYFIDACRNQMDGSQIKIGSLLPDDPQVSEEASTFVLQSTVEGAIAAADGAFHRALLGGLEGKGRAKTWHPRVPDAMFVRHDSLRGYLEDLLAQKQKISHKEEGSARLVEAILNTLRPVPQSKCTISVEGLMPPLQGEVVYTRNRSSTEQRQPIVGHPIELLLEPDDYSISLRLKNGALATATPMPVDLYGDRHLVFKPATGRGFESVRRSPSLAAVEIVMPEGCSLKLKHLSTAQERAFTGSTTAHLRPGSYAATLLSANGSVLKQQKIDLGTEANAALNVTGWQNSLPHVSIATRLPAYAVRDNAVEFSESLGPIPDSDLDLWLALVGGGRILGSTGDYSKLAGFPLHDFSGEGPAASPIYILAGFDRGDIRFKVALSQGKRVKWGAAGQPTGMAGIREAYFSTAPGSHLVSFQVDDHPAYTVTSFASSNRATLITLTLDAEQDFRVSQYLLPLGHRIGELPAEIRDRLIHRNYLRDLRFLAQASRAFRNRREISKEIPSPELIELLNANWLDPIASSLAAYEATRRGQQEEMREVVKNMKRFFTDLPDTWALAKFAGENVEPHGTPLFLDGLRAFSGYPEWLPLPAANLDFTSPWTAWRAAVEGD